MSEIKEKELNYTNSYFNLYKTFEKLSGVNLNNKKENFNIISFYQDLNNKKENLSIINFYKNLNLINFMRDYKISNPKVELFNLENQIENDLKNLDDQRIELFQSLNSGIFKNNNFFPEYFIPKLNKKLNE